MNAPSLILAVLTTQPTTTPSDGTSALNAALSVSGVSLIGIFAVMLLFAALIVLLGTIFPHDETPSE